MSLFIKGFSLYNAIELLVILYPASGNLVVEVEARHSHQIPLVKNHTFKLGLEQNYFVFFADVFGLIVVPSSLNLTSYVSVQPCLILYQSVVLNHH